MFNTNIYAKCEFMQPGGSIKDRAALQIIKDTYLNHQLTQNQPVIEMTSGNMGAGLAIVCSQFKNPFIACMSKGNSIQRKIMLENQGAQVILVDQIDGLPGQVIGNYIKAAEEKAKQIAKQLGAFYVDQFNNKSSMMAHELHTGPEILNQLKDINAFVEAVGSGGTFIGTSKFLKSQNEKILCAVVEPSGSQILAGHQVIDAKHNMQGMGYGQVVPFWNPIYCDEFLSVDSKESQYFKKLLALQEGLYVGFSAAANICASVKLSQKYKLNNVVTILCDTGLKY